MKDSRILKEELLQGKYEELFRDIYQDENEAKRQNSRYAQAVAKFEELFGEKQVEIYSAPGRSEVGGNHTDHQHGMVLATSINLDAIGIVSPSASPVIQVVSEGYDMVEVDIEDLEEKYEEEGTTAALIRGVAAALAEKGYKIGGFQAYITSDVLIGAGLSSSAAFEIIIGTIFSGLFNNMEIDPVEIAKAGQYAENVYFGKPCGLMDQMASAVGGLIHIDFQDPQVPSVKKVPSDFQAYQYSLCIVDTKASHANLTDDYAKIPEEMKKVAAFFKKNVLREVEEEEFFREIPGLRSILGDRPVLRALHFFEEEKRVEKQVEALEQGDFPRFLELVKESGNSSFKYLQNIYINRDEQNQSMSVALGASESILQNHGVSRVHGGGFAGTIQVFAENSYVEEYRNKIDHIFGKGSCHVLKVRQQGGIKVIG
ncbi:MAG TPA: galactokinase [Candidatus Blautia pullistercoris]|uniref:Galactokinase n=1 Tax=Candidatus Blautia pullistercoris TaxID=2838499 RepID=A0A9D2AND1_9FIRM|nr:galactokinase [Clostridiales bacterium]HIX37777.1 galactokinase [Candidatus Blautia pullistercoris]